MQTRTHAALIVTWDVVELAPAYDHADISAIAAATVVQRHIGALARKRRAP